MSVSGMVLGSGCLYSSTLTFGWREKFEVVRKNKHWFVLFLPDDQNWHDTKCNRYASPWDHFPSSTVACTNCVHTHLYHNNLRALCHYTILSTRIPSIGFDEPNLLAVYSNRRPKFVHMNHIESIEQIELYQMLAPHGGHCNHHILDRIQHEAIQIHREKINIDNDYWHIQPSI